MKLKSLMFFICLTLGLGSLTNCSEEPPFTAEELSLALPEIGEALRGVDGFDDDIWDLVLVGDHETVVKDLCKDVEGDCDYKNSDFQKLIAGNEYFDKLDSEAQTKLLRANKYFSGNKVPVYDADGKKLDKYLNQINTYLGTHELTLAKTSIIKFLHANDFGDIFWKVNDDEENENEIEAFTNAQNCPNDTDNNCITTELTVDESKLIIEVRDCNFQQDSASCQLDLLTGKNYTTYRSENLSLHINQSSTGLSEAYGEPVQDDDGNKYRIQLKAINMPGESGNCEKGDFWSGYVYFYYILQLQYFNIDTPNEVHANNIKTYKCQ